MGGVDLAGEEDRFNESKQKDIALTESRLKRLKATKAAGGEGWDPGQLDAEIANAENRLQEILGSTFQGMLSGNLNATQQQAPQIVTGAMAALKTQADENRKNADAFLNNRTGGGANAAEQAADDAQRPSRRAAKAGGGRQGRGRCGRSGASSRLNPAKTSTASASASPAEVYTSSAALVARGAARAESDGSPG